MSCPFSICGSRNPRKVTTRSRSGSRPTNPTSNSIDEFFLVAGSSSSHRAPYPCSCRISSTQELDEVIIEETPLLLFCLVSFVVTMRVSFTVVLSSFPFISADTPPKLWLLIQTQPSNSLWFNRSKVSLFCWAALPLATPKKDGPETARWACFDRARAPTVNPLFFFFLFLVNDNDSRACL